MRKPRLVIAGGAGYLGQILGKYFRDRGWIILILSRRGTRSEHDGLNFVPWDGETLGSWTSVLQSADAIVNLAGRTVNCRYTSRHRQEIYDSRLRSTRLLGEAVSRCEKPPPVWINASSATIYRHAMDRPMDEHAGEIGTGFSVDVCQKWERTLEEANTAHTRKVALRSALVLGTGAGGVFEAFARIVRIGLGGTLGSGEQLVSWVHSLDFCRAMAWLIEHNSVSGAINCASPQPVTNREFMAAFREALRMRVGLPAPSWLLEIGALFLRTETELLLKSRWVLPRRLLESGFEFTYPHIGDALAQVTAASRALGSGPPRLGLRAEGT